MFKINHVWHIDCDKFQNIYLFVYIFHLSKFTWVKRKPNPKQTAKNKESNYIVSTNDKKIPCPLSWFLAFIADNDVFLLCLFYVSLDNFLDESFQFDVFLFLHISKPIKF